VEGCVKVGDVFGAREMVEGDVDEGEGRGVVAVKKSTQERRRCGGRFTVVPIQSDLRSPG
jgi:hypothetical protein